ncbi:unnamed protein product, partial [Meganyctiphanes norvegica]
MSASSCIEERSTRGVFCPSVTCHLLTNKRVQPCLVVICQHERSTRIPPAGIFTIFTISGTNDHTAIWVISLVLSAEIQLLDIQLCLLQYGGSSTRVSLLPSLIPFLFGGEGTFVR